MTSANLGALPNLRRTVGRSYCRAYRLRLNGIILTLLNDPDALHFEE